MANNNFNGEKHSLYLARAMPEEVHGLEDTTSAEKIYDDTSGSLPSNDPWLEPSGAFEVNKFYAWLVLVCVFVIITGGIAMAIRVIDL